MALTVFIVYCMTGPCDHNTLGYCAGRCLARCVPGCGPGDLDGDNDVDLRDVAIAQNLAG